ncbi:hypothetical protein BKA93DRAFT_693092, partial [Sparassis latifolia]
TKMQYHQKLPKKVYGLCRNHLIHGYCTWKGKQYMPKSMHQELHWSAQKPFNVQAPEDISEWQILEIKKTKKNKSTDLQDVDESEPISKKNIVQYIPAQETKQLNTLCNDPAERCRFDIGSAGFKWNANTYSCAYDVLFGILFTLYKGSSNNWTNSLQDNNPH